MFKWIPLSAKLTKLFKTPKQAVFVAATVAFSGGVKQSTEVK
jgi:hypothetical protein